MSTNSAPDLSGHDDASQHMDDAPVLDLAAARGRYATGPAPDTEPDSIPDSPADTDPDVDPDTLVFAGPSKRRPPLRRNNFRKLVDWVEAVDAIGAKGLHFHDLRHTGNTLAAMTGASTRDLMTRMGHDS